MIISYFGEKIFFDEIKNTSQIWVARSDLKNILYLELDRDVISLPIWSTYNRAQNYLDNARPIGPKYNPDVVPVETFINSWLSDKMMGITEVLINPDGRNPRMLALYPDEFVTSRAS